jgi:hypothetical protein
MINSRRRMLFLWKWDSAELKLLSSSGSASRRCPCDHCTRRPIDPATLYARPDTDGARRIGGLGMAGHTSAHAEAKSANQPLQPSRKSRELLRICEEIGNHGDGGQDEKPITHNGTGYQELLTPT